MCFLGLEKKFSPAAHLEAGNEQISPSPIDWYSFFRKKIFLAVLRSAKVARVGEGKMTDYKARFCFQGNHRRLGKDHSYAEIYTSTLRLSTLRASLAQFIQYKPEPGLEMGIELWDIAQAFLIAVLNKYTAMRAPQGVKGMEGKGLELLSPLYGMAEAHQYYDKWLTNVLLKMGFKQAADPKY